MPYNGRYSQLTNSEILKLNKFCIKEVKKFNKLIIVSDPIHASTDEKLKFAIHAKRNGADIFLQSVEKSFLQMSKFINIIEKCRKLKFHF